MFEYVIVMILELEGGYVNDPKDAGGETNYGISKRSYPDVDIKNLTEAQAVDIYRRDYWDKINGEEMDQAIATIVMDMAVHMGPASAAKVLQRVLGVKDDGIIGPDTLDAMEEYPEMVELATELTAARIYRYSNTKGWKDYRKGWINRAMHVCKKAFEEC